jgi:hypothetical protein
MAMTAKSLTSSSARPGGAWSPSSSAIAAPRRGEASNALEAHCTHDQWGSVLFSFPTARRRRLLQREKCGNEDSEADLAPYAIVHEIHNLDVPVRDVEFFRNRQIPVLISNIVCRPRSGGRQYSQRLEGPGHPCSMTNECAWLCSNPCTTAERCAGSVRRNTTT